MSASSTRKSPGNWNLPIVRNLDMAVKKPVIRTRLTLPTEKSKETSLRRAENLLPGKLTKLLPKDNSTAKALANWAAHSRPVLTVAL